MHRDHRYSHVSEQALAPRQSLYAEVTAKVIAELEAGRLPWTQPWTQPWSSAACACDMPRSAVTGRRYSGINILILWGAVIDRGYAGQGWLTYRQAEAAGGRVRRGERGVTVCYADRFTPRSEQERATEQGDEARVVRFLKRFTVFNTEQCDGLPKHIADIPQSPRPHDALPHADALIAETGADLRIMGDRAFYVPSQDYIQVPPPYAYPDPINWYRTAFHELGHWTGHKTRLGRDLEGRFGDAFYAREELIAEMASAFVCASLGIIPTVRHADYIGAWLDVLREDERAIFKAASQASKAADLILDHELGGQ